MNSNLENFAPRLKRGRVIPQGSRIIFETEDPYNQIVLPMALADMVLLCSGQFTVREIIEKIYKKQGAVPFKAILTAVHLLHQGGFFENGHELELSSHLQSWMKPRGRGWHLGWRFGQRIVASHRSPLAYYILTLGLLLGSILGLPEFPDHPLRALERWITTEGAAWGILGLWACTSILQTVRYLSCGLQLLLLTSKAYNVALRLSPWGLHLHVGDEANDLFENRLYTSMFHVSQIMAPWWVVLAASVLGPARFADPLVLAAAVITFWELNPFVNGEGRKLMRALLIPDDRDVVSWHFDANTLINSINPEARRRDQDFARSCAVWGVFWLAGCAYVLLRSATAFLPGLMNDLTGQKFSAWPLVGLLAWLAGLYAVTQTVVEVIGATVIKGYFTSALALSRRARAAARREWPEAEVLKHIEGLPLFSHFHEEFLQKITKRAEMITFAEGAVIVAEGDVAHDLYVLLEGEVDVRRPGHALGVSAGMCLSAVSVFGEAALVDASPRQATVTARGSVVVLRVPVRAIREVALESHSVRQLEVFRNAILVNQFFASSPVFRSLSLASVDFLSSRGTLEYFDANQFVFQQGDRGDSFFLILRGSVSVNVHGTIIKHLNQGSFFGEIALIANIPRTATIQSVEPVVCFKISSDAFWEVLVQHMDLGVFIETVSESRLKEDLAVVAPHRDGGLKISAGALLMARRVLALLIGLSPVPFIFNSCRGNLLGGANFASSSCTVALERNQLVSIGSKLNAKSKVFAARKLRAGTALLDGASRATSTLTQGTEFAVIVDRACLAAQVGDFTDEPITQAVTQGQVGALTSQAYSWKLPRDYDEADLEAQVAKEPCLKGLSPNQTYTIKSLSFDDPNQGQQSYLAPDNAVAAWNGFYGSAIGMPINSGRPVVVAVIDTGADYTHPDINAHMWAGGAFGIGVDIPTYTPGAPGGNYYPIDISSIGHGTHVSGMIAALGNNTTGITGMMPYNANIMSIRLFGTDSSGNLTTSSQYFYSAIQFAIDHGADVINLSLGSITQGPASDPVAEQAVINAVNAGITVVTVIGNADSGNGQLIDGVNLSSIPGMFSTIYGVIGVGAYDTTTGQKSYFSHYSTTYAEIGAPGEESSSSGLYSTLPTNLGSYGRLSGTSQAAPQVTAAAALTIGLIRNNYGVAPTPKETELLIETGARQSANLAPYFKNGNYLDLSNLLTTIHQAYPLTATGGHASLNCN